CQSTLSNATMPPTRSDGSCLYRAACTAKVIAAARDSSGPSLLTSVGGGDQGGVLADPADQGGSAVALEGQPHESIVAEPITVDLLCWRPDRTRGLRGAAPLS